MYFPALNLPLPKTLINTTCSMSQYCHLIYTSSYSSISQDLLTMRIYTFFSLVSVSVLLLTTCKALRPYHFTHQSKGTYKGEESNRHNKAREIGMELYPTGSNLPDCSHACGPCTPCRRVVVSFTTCSVESCPVIYRCMCKGKYYHVPSY